MIEHYKWSNGCDFPNHDYMNISATRQECGEICFKDCMCTHFVWNMSSNGTCWLKAGAISETKAIIKPDPTIQCGLILSRSRSCNNSECFLFRQFAYNDLFCL
jgi:hypothetical protein